MRMAFTAWRDQIDHAWRRVSTSGNAGQQGSGARWAGGGLPAAGCRGGAARCAHLILLSFIAQRSQPVHQLRVRRHRRDLVRHVVLAKQALLWGSDAGVVCVRGKPPGAGVGVGRPGAGQCGALSSGPATFAALRTVRMRHAHTASQSAAGKMTTRAPAWLDLTIALYSPAKSDHGTRQRMVGSAEHQQWR